MQASNTKFTHNLHIYNTLTQRKEKFVPLHDNDVGMYVCGMTVYDYCHVGNWRVFVFFDVVARYLRALGFNLKYVRNITDIDDKIIKRARELKEDFRELTVRFTEAMHEDERALGALPPDIEPTVTANMEEIKSIIATLVAKNYAYVAANGDVYFDIAKFPAYGALAHQDLESLQAGARIEVNEVKHNPLDFVLWKMAKPGEPAWESPWGPGRPGWHIECSAMAQRYLGKHFDIHGGGADLQFPHHQNEVAQSEAAFGEKFVNFWMHVGFVRVDNEKMSKSLGNFFTVRDVLKKYSPEVLRYFMLASHYRSPLNYTTDNLDMAQAAVRRLYTALRGLNLEGEGKVQCAAQDIFAGSHEELVKAFYAAMDDDFNTPVALSVLFDLARRINKLKDDGDIKTAQKTGCVLWRLGAILGLLSKDPEEFLQGGGGNEINEIGAPSEVSDKSGVELDKNFIEEQIAARNAARARKDFAAADSIRAELLKQGVVLEDTPRGTTWKISVSP